MKNFKRKFQMFLFLLLSSWQQSPRRKVKAEEYLAILVIVGMLVAVGLTVVNCDGTLVRGLFWFECLPYRTLK